MDVFTNLVRISGFSSLFPAIAVTENTAIAERKERKTQKSSLISEEEVNN